ncbi:hypothetical protein [Mycobacterium stomatepiae]|uniref:Bile-acid 7-alpha-dehydratase n=1 Tax=Mycobacterium stomatepiae TaxID=470076 RepID=A0A7I7QHA8_9MYCO|nr:hypothetical protein [Mycobacterium stomatepiae]MCV7167838.1 hypothetical protein [Mycobacterium stomatepiae]BBY25306.1 bile-acid 7-alpha-dehydratase [Mycobacterium stomatepiae]
MTRAGISAADELEELGKLKARYCCLPDTKDVEACVFTTDMVVTPEPTLTSATTATGSWAMQDLPIFAGGREMHGAEIAVGGYAGFKLA